MANHHAPKANIKKPGTATFKSMRLTDTSPFSIQEAYKALRTNLSFSLMGKKCIGITSAQQHDGKSTIAINLGVSFAQLGKKVLVIDADLRLPTIAKKLRVPMEPGFSNFMIHEANFSECIRKTGWTDVDFMTAGTLPPDPSKILDSPAIEAFLEKMSERYDLIILDLPPINTVADAAMLAKHGVEGYLIVVRHDYTDLRQVGELIKKMQFVNAEVLGFVYNDARLNTQGSYYKSSYGYGYGRSKK